MTGPVGAGAAGGWARKTVVDLDAVRVANLDVAAVLAGGRVLETELV